METPKHQAGFNLVEMSLVLVIIGILLTGLLQPLLTQFEISQRKKITRQLDDIHGALLGFAATTGRLPCPAQSNSFGLSVPNIAAATCTQVDGFVPVRTLGVNGPINGNSLLVDPWNNPIRYRLSAISAYSDDITLAMLGTVPDMKVCQIDYGTDPSTCGIDVAENLVAVVYSTGDSLSSSPWQVENTNGDTQFATGDFSVVENKEFDDYLRWISPNILAYHLVLAGQLD